MAEMKMNPAVIITVLQNVVKAINGLEQTTGQQQIIPFVAAPATATSAGVAGNMAYDSSYFYICTATNTWKRVAIAGGF